MARARGSSTRAAPGNGTEIMQLRVALALILAVLTFPAVGRAVAAPDCAGAARPGWSSQEVWTWRQICAGQPADLEKGYPGSSAARVLSPDFLTALLFDPQLKALIPHTGIAIAGGEVPGALGLGNAAPG